MRFVTELYSDILVNVFCTFFSFHVLRSRFVFTKQSLESILTKRPTDFEKGKSPLDYDLVVDPAVRFV